MLATALLDRHHWSKMDSQLPGINAQYPAWRTLNALPTIIAKSTPEAEVSVRLLGTEDRANLLSITTGVILG